MNTFTSQRSLIYLIVTVGVAIFEFTIVASLWVNPNVAPNTLTIVTTVALITSFLVLQLLKEKVYKNDYNFFNIDKDLVRKKINTVSALFFMLAISTIVFMLFTVYWLAAVLFISCIVVYFWIINLLLTGYQKVYDRVAATMVQRILKATYSKQKILGLSTLADAKRTKPDVWCVQLYAADPAYQAMHITSKDAVYIPKQYLLLYKWGLNDWVCVLKGERAKYKVGDILHDADLSEPLFFLQEDSLDTFGMQVLRDVTLTTAYS